jgi:hypothetical protein
MCIDSTISCDFLCFLPPGISCHRPQDDTQHGENLVDPYTSHYHNTFTFSTAAPTSSTARQPVRLATDQSFEGAKDPVNIQHPPSHVVNCSFDLLELSLDPTLSGDPLNTTSLPFHIPLSDGVSPDVSSIAAMTSCYFLQTRVCAEGAFSNSPPLEPRQSKRPHPRTFWFPTCNPRRPSRLRSLPKIKTGSGDRNLAV